MEEEMMNILSKGKLEVDDMCRLSELFEYSKEIDNGKTYLDIYNKFISKGLTKKQN